MKHLKSIRDFINDFINWIYPPFSKYIPKPTFKYAFCGGTNTALDIFLYSISYNFILQKRVLDLHFISVSPHIASLFFSIPITFVTGFLLSKYITFTGSSIKGRIQLMRYGLTVFVCVVLNFIFIKLFVDVCGFYPSISKVLTSGLVIIYSYFSQKHFTFNVAKKELV